MASSENYGRFKLERFILERFILERFKLERFYCFLVSFLKVNGFNTSKDLSIKINFLIVHHSMNF